MVVEPGGAWWSFAKSVMRNTHMAFTSNFEMRSPATSAASNTGEETSARILVLCIFLTGNLMFMAYKASITSIGAVRLGACQTVRQLSGTAGLRLSVHSYCPVLHCDACIVPNYANFHQMYVGTVYVQAPQLNMSLGCCFSLIITGGRGFVLENNFLRASNQSTAFTELAKKFFWDGSSPSQVNIFGSERQGMDFMLTEQKVQ